MYRVDLDFPTPAAELWFSTFGGPLLPSGAAIDIAPPDYEGSVVNPGEGVLMVPGSTRIYGWTTTSNPVTGFPLLMTSRPGRI